MQISHYFDLLKHHVSLIALMFITIVGGVVSISAFFLFVSPFYTGTAVVSLLPTQSELAFSQNTVRSTSINAANLLSQTHIEYLTSREVARLAVDRLAAEANAARAESGEPETTSERPSGLTDRLANSFRTFRREFRRIYNTLNSGRHVPLDPYTDTVLSLQDSIEIEMIEGTYILEISVRWTTPEGAASAANVLADVYVERVREEAVQASVELERELRAELARGEGNFASLQQQINTLRLTRAAQLDFLRVIDTAPVPLYPSFPKVVLNTVFAVVGWVFAATFAVIAIDTFSNKVTTQSDAMRVFDGRFLGRIKLRRKSSRQRRQVAEILRRLTTPLLDRGGTMSLGTREESGGLNHVIRHAMAGNESPPGDGTRAALTVGSATGNSGGVTPSSSTSTSTRSQLRQSQQVENADEFELEAESPLALVQKVNPATFPDFGGVLDDFNYAAVDGAEWMVVALKPGKVSESDLMFVIEELQNRGVRHVFGAFVKG